jgi:hypothetical protein
LDATSIDGLALLELWIKRRLVFQPNFRNFHCMSVTTFSVTSCAETGGYVARWDDPAGGGITTQGDTIAELEAMIRDAVIGYFC